MRWLIALFATFCLPALAADPVRVGFAAQAFIFTGAVDVGLENGIFARFGLDIQPTTYGGGAKLHGAMIAGAEDVAFGGGSDYAFLVKGSPERGVYGVVNEPFSVVISAADPAIRTAEDLKGRRVGVTTTGSYTYWFAMELPHFRKWAAGEKVNPVSIGGSLSGQTAALLSGQVDATVGDLVLGLSLQEQGRGHVVVNAAEMVKDVISSLVFAHTDFIAAHPDVLRRFLAGVHDAIAFMLAHPDQTARLTARVNGLSESVATRYIAMTEAGWSRDGRMSQAQLRATAEAIEQAGLLDSVPDLAPLTMQGFGPAGP